MRPPKHTLMPRRDWLVGALSAAALAGCRSEPETALPSSTGTIRTNVPLRVVWVGEASDAEILKRTWAQISEQPLDVRMLASPRHLLAGDVAAPEPPEFGRDLSQAAASADVVIYPLSSMSELVAEKRLMPLLKQPQSVHSSAAPEENMSGVFMGGERASVPVALRVATSYSDERLAAPLGGYLPALLVGQDASEMTIRSWEDYDSFVETSAGKCCEPTAPAWAASAYLWRLVSSLSTTWLFERESLRPLLSEPEYVAVLDQMARTVKKSASTDQGRSPTQIYDAVASGELLGGIGFPQPLSDHASGTAVALAALPIGELRAEGFESRADWQPEHRRDMVDPFMLVGSLAAACRQTAAASAFVTWIGGGQGSEPLYREIASMIDTTLTPKESSSDTFERYRGWVIAQYRSASFVPTLNIPGAIEYYDALDQGVRACVHGDVSAKQACAEITDRWVRLHHKYGLPSQQRAWRRAQGI